MKTSYAGAVATLQKGWGILGNIPGGRRLFAVLLGRIVPYSGTVRPEIVELAPGRAKVALPVTHITRNHLGSAHALALANVGELACGLALHMCLPPGYGAILRRIEVHYIRKAKGKIFSECSLDTVAFHGDSQLRAESSLTDASGTLVARAETEWKVGPLVSATTKAHGASQ